MSLLLPACAIFEVLYARYEYSILTAQEDLVFDIDDATHAC
jgi:hypothetical protein